MSDSRIAAMAILVATAAFSPISLPVLPFAVAAIVALVARRQRVMIGALALAVSAHCAHEWKALHEPLPKFIEGNAALVTDPERSGSSVRAEVTVEDRHYEIWSTAGTRVQLSSLRAGNRVRVIGVVRELSGKRAPGLRRRHIAGTIAATRLESMPSTQALDALPNGIRSVLEQGSASMSPDNKALFTGLIYGDDRALPEESIEEFRESGLGHLTAVSGANVAFVLALSMPFLRSFGLLGRFTGGIGVLLLFGTVTRWEPSVLRAEAMAAVVMFAVFLGRPVSLIRSLSIATTGLLVVDPFLIGSTGFLLSVAACTGMALAGESISSWCPGRDWFQRILGYSVAAQLAVLPLQLAFFGSFPWVALAANVLAGPAAGLVMMWGLPAGFAAGVLGEPFAAILHLPTTVLLEWVRLVARAGASGNADPVVRWVALLVPVLALVSWKRRAAVDQREGVIGPHYADASE